MRWLPLLLLTACGTPAGTWVLSIDRASVTSEGCPTSEMDGQVQFEAELYKAGDDATAYIADRAAVLSGTWSGKDLLLEQDDDQALSGTAIRLTATVAGGELDGTWFEATPSLDEPSCARTYPLTGWRLSDATVAP